MFNLHDELKKGFLSKSQLENLCSTLQLGSKKSNILVHLLTENSNNSDNSSKNNAQITFHQFREGLLKIITSEGKNDNQKISILLLRSRSSWFSFVISTFLVMVMVFSGHISTLLLLHSQRGPSNFLLPIERFEKYFKNHGKNSSLIEQTKNIIYNIINVNQGRCRGVQRNSYFLFFLCFIYFCTYINNITYSDVQNVVLRWTRHFLWKIQFWRFSFGKFSGTDWF